MTRIVLPVTCPDCHTALDVTVETGAVACSPGCTGWTKVVQGTTYVGHPSLPARIYDKHLSWAGPPPKQLHLSAFETEDARRRLDEIAGRVTATSGEPGFDWEADEEGIRLVDAGGAEECELFYNVWYDDGRTEAQVMADAEFCAHARADIYWLLGKIGRLVGEIIPFNYRDS